MSPDEYIRHLKQQLREAAEDAVRNAAPDVESELKRQLPANRTKTRRAVRGVARRNRLHLQLDFDQRYRQRGTNSERLLRTAARRSRPKITRHLKRHLLKALNR